MFGVFATALPTAILSVQFLKRRGAHTLEARRFRSGRSLLSPAFDTHGGAIFGLGWALTGACPGPLFALLGSGVTVMVVAIAAAVAGTWTHGAVRATLPH